MIELDDFPAFLRETLHAAHAPDGPTLGSDEGCAECADFSPFPWQCAYLRAVAEGASWPDLDVPTSLGKTMLIDIWLFLLAWERAVGRPRTVPLRLFFVVDRRLIVDQAHAHAQHLARLLGRAEPGTLCAVIATALREIGGEIA